MDSFNGTLVCTFLYLRRHTTAVTVRITKSKTPAMMKYWPWWDWTTRVLCNWEEIPFITTALLWQPADKEMQRNSMHGEKNKDVYISKECNPKQWYINHYLEEGYSHSAECDVQQVATHSSGIAHTLPGCA